MLAKLRKDQENEEGFTLIELLVVVIIIGILAAIAIPAFLNQRERAYQAGLVSDVRNAALDIEALGTANNGKYPAATAANYPDTYESSAPTETTLTLWVADDLSDFCLRGVRTDINEGTAGVKYVTADGGMQPFSPTAVPTCADMGTAAADTTVTLTDG